MSFPSSRAHQLHERRLSIRGSAERPTNTNADPIAQALIVHHLKRRTAMMASIITEGGRNRSADLA